MEEKQPAMMPCIATEIKSATVFLQGAQITRTAAAAVQPGENTARLGPLPKGLLPASLRVTAAGARVGAVAFEISHIETAENTAKLQALAARRDALRQELSDLAGQHETAAQQSNMLAGNCCTGRDRTLAQIKELAGYFRAENAALQAELARLDRAQTEKKAELARVEAEIGGQDSTGRPVGVLTVTLLAAAAGQAQLTIVYTDDAAGWEPRYDLCTAAGDAPAKLIARAVIRQKTGEDWNGLPVVLSSGRPQVGMNRPRLRPWRIGGPASIPMQMMARAAAPMPMMAAAGSAGDTAELPPLPEALVREGGSTVEFVLPAPIRVENGGAGRYAIREYTLTAEYTYYNAAKLDKHTWLLARIAGWKSLNLLPGECSVFLNDAFVGTTRLDPRAAEDAMELSLGQDSAVPVTREKVADNNSRALLGGQHKAVQCWELTACNTKSVPVLLELHDQLPIPADAAVKVAPEELSGAEQGEQGALCWRITLQPGQTVKKQLRYSVTWPKDRRVVLD